jgi:hypothetical protein
VIDFHLDKGRVSRVRVRESNYIGNTIHNLTDKVQKKGKGRQKREFLPHADAHVLFREEVLSLLSRWKPRRFVAERFLARGFRSNTGEMLSYMLGCLSEWALVSGADPRLVLPAQWKNKVNSLSEGKDFLDSIYVIAKKRGLQSHTVDTVLIALYDVTQKNGIELTRKLVKSTVCKARIN